MAVSGAFFTALITLLLTIPLLSQATPFSKVDDPEVCQSSICRESARILLESMDTSVDPCDDFYRYACGGWIDKHPILADNRSHSVYGDLIDEVDGQVTELLGTSPAEGLVKPLLDAVNFLQGCIDEESREKQSLDPLKNLLKSLGGWPMVDPGWSDAGYQWENAVATIQRILGVDIIIDIMVDADMWDISRNIIFITEPSFGLSTKYLENLTASDETKERVAAYRDYIIATGKLLNGNIHESTLGKDADEIIAFESALSQPPFEKTEQKIQKPWYDYLLEDIRRKITKDSGGEGMPISELQNLTKSNYFKWTDFLNTVLQDFPAVTDETKISLYDATYIPHAIKFAHEANPRTLANYIGWILLKHIGPYTTKGFMENESRFKEVMDDVDDNDGGKEPKELKKTCLKETMELLGFAVARLYVDKYVSEEERRDVEELIEDVRSAYEVNLNHNSWMDPSTKNKALEKLRAMINCLGYPSWIKNDTELSDYYSLVPDVRKEEFFASFLKAKAAAQSKYLQKWNQKSERATTWSSLPTVVNAFYDVHINSMTFPAAIFNRPIYMYGRSPVLNYAGIGSFAAHEISHGFDDEGSMYDKEGKMSNWWSPETKTKFREKTECLKKQYSNFVDPLTNKSVNGRRTLGDNIADNGGVRNAYMAYKMKILQSEENEVTPNLRLPGIAATPEQLFFLGFATMECSHYTKKKMEWTIDFDAHAPPEYRVLGPLSNSRAFAEAFSCPVGSRMNPEHKCQLW